jgi:hypothetical protein
MMNALHSLEPPMPSSHSMTPDHPSEDLFPREFSTGRQRCCEEEMAHFEEESVNRPELLNAGALNVINRVSNKLTGT